jgi:hypothetical protein
MACAAVLATVGTASLVAGSPAGAIPTTIYVGSAVGLDTSCTSTGFATIQGAVSAAVSGDTIVVCPGTYAEQVTVTGFSSLAIVGSGSSQSVVEPTALTCDPTATKDDTNASVHVAAAIEVTDSTNVTIEDLGVNGTNITNGQITCVQSTTPEFWGIRYAVASGTVIEDAVTNIRQVSAGADGDGVVIDNTNLGAVAVEGTTVAAFGNAGIVCVEASTSCSVAGNTVGGSGADPSVGQDGIVVAWGATATLSDNSVSEFDSTGGSQANCVLVLESSNVTVGPGNSLVDCQDAVVLQSWGETGAAAMSNDTVADNSIYFTTSNSATWETNGTRGVDVAAFPGFAGANPSSITATIDANLIEGPGAYTGITPTVDSTPAGIEVGDVGGEIGYTSGPVNVSAQANAVENWSMDAEIVGAGTGVATAGLNYNEFIGARVGILNASGLTSHTGAITPNATESWWGCSTGPNGGIGCSTTSGSVSDSPYLASVAMSPNAQAVPQKAQATVTATLRDNTGATVFAPLDIIFSTSPNVGGETLGLFDGTASFSLTDALMQTVTVTATIGFGPTFALIPSTLAGVAAVAFGAIPLRIFGVDAIGTSIAISQTEFPHSGSAGGVVLARDDFFSDALAGGPLAAQIHGPLLETEGADQSSTIDPRVLAEIQRVLPFGGTVYVLGGDLALSPNIDATLKSLGYLVIREAGANEYSTAVDIAEAMGNPATIFEATGTSFYDALSAEPAAIEAHGAILLTDGATESAETFGYVFHHLGDTRYAIGGPSAASGADPGAIAIYGQNLFSTSAAVASTFFPNAKIFGVATTADFSDALGGGVFMATGGTLGPVLLVNPTTPLPAEILPYLNSLAPGTPSYVFGGPFAVSDAVLVAVEGEIG